MPYKSEAQRRFFNSPAGKEQIGEEEVEHWNEESKGMKLPEKAVDKAIDLCDEFVEKEELEEDDIKSFIKSGFSKATSLLKGGIKNARY